MYKVKYKIKSSNIEKAANAIAIGQSTGNPNIRSTLESNETAAIVLDIDKNIVTIAFKYKNLNRISDVAQMLCTIQGGQSDIDLLQECKIIDIEISTSNINYTKKWKHPTHRPLVGGIIKPKTGLTKDKLQNIVLQMCNGGIDWIKEDEILGDPSYLSLQQRVDIISKILDSYPNVMYCFCVNGSPSHYLNQLDLVEKTNLGVHTNFWSGLNVYEDAHLKNIFMHFQRSGIRILTDNRNPWSISWKVIVKLAILQGIDSIHLGMIGGYYPDDVQEVYDTLKLCQENNRIGALSCGMNPEIAKKLKNELGNNFMANVGGWLHTDGKIEENVKKMLKAVS